MAIEVGQALVRLGAEAGGLQGQLDQAKGQTNKWASGVGKNIKTVLGGAVLGGVTLVAGAVAGIGKAAIDMAGDTRQAQADVRAQFGQTAEEAERTAALARAAWGDNWGESITDVATAIGTVEQQLGELGVTSDQELTRMATHAIGLRDTYGTEVTEGVDAAKTLMENFGLSGQEAFDFIASGMQRGLDRSGDFLDTINEYGVQFSEGGASATNFFSALETGLAGGMLGTDKAADAFKEFRVRIQDGSATTRDALENIGISADQLFASMASGEVTTVEAWDKVTEALRNTDDEAVKMQAGVGLIGTQWEDLGEEAILAMDLWGTSMEELQGGTDALSAKYTSLGSVFEAGKRRILVSLAPISDMMLDIADRVMPIIFGVIDEWAPKIENIAAIFSGFITEFIGSLEAGLTPLEALGEALDTFIPEELMDTIWAILLGLQSLWTSLVEGLAPVLEAAAQFVSWKDVLIILAGVIAATVIPIIVSLIGTILSVAAPIVAIIAAVALFRKAWETNFLGIRDAVNAVIGWLVPFVQNAIALIRAWWAENGEAILAKVQEIWNTIQAVITFVIGAVQAIISSILGQIKKSWEEHGEGITAAAREAWEAIKAAISAAITFIKDSIIIPIANAIKGFWEEHGAAIMAGAEEAWGKVKEVIDQTFQNLQTALEAFTALFSGDWEGFGESIGELWDGIWQNVVSILEGLWALISPVLAGLWADIQGWFTGMDWAGLGLAIINGIISGLTSAASSLYNTITGIINTVRNVAGGAAGEGSPAKLFVSLGDSIAQGLALGMDQASAKIDRAAVGMVDRSVHTTNNYYLTANYPMQSADSLAGDIRTLQILREA